MDQVNFRQWLDKQGYKKKVQGDCISRLNRIERELNYIDLDDEYERDKCEVLYSYFDNNGKNDLMTEIKNTTLPIGKYSMGMFRYAINKYLAFKES